MLEVVLYGIKQSGKLNHTRILNNASSSSLTLREFSEIFWKMDVMYYLIQGTSFVLHIFVLFYSQVKNIDMPLAIVSFCFYINSFVTGKNPKISRTLSVWNETRSRKYFFKKNLHDWKLLSSSWFLIKLISNGGCSSYVDLLKCYFHRIGFL